MMLRLLCLVSAIAVSHPFLITTLTVEHTPTQLFNTGGWGIGPQRDLTDAEFLRGDRRAFSGYELQPDFGRRVEAASKALRDEEMAELMGVAAAAGIDMNKKKDTLNKFSKEDILDEDEDDLDLSVDWDEKAPIAEVNEKLNTDESITRLDEDTGALGTW